jgi:hemolysin III
LSHFAGAALSVAGMVLLIVWSHGEPWRVVSFSLYGATLIMLYMASGIYHGLPVSPRAQEWLMRLDHAAITLLIAGSFIPMCLVTLRGALGWSLFGVVVGIALAGSAVVLFVPRTPHWVRLVLYIGLGWMAAAMVPSLRRILPPEAIGWLLAGGITYTLGAAVYASGRPRLWPGVFGSHDLWHIFVLGGSVCHWVFMLYLLPGR